MTLLDPSGRPMRSFGAAGFGTRRKIPVERLEAGMMLCEHIHGFRGKVLVCEGEVLTQKHVEQIKKWIERPGVGCLLKYTREVWAKATLGSGEERPKCETDPYAAHSIQKLYKRGQKVAQPRVSGPSAARKVYKFVDGKMTEVE